MDNSPWYKRNHTITPPHGFFMLTIHCLFNGMRIIYAYTFLCISEYIFLKKVNMWKKGAIKNMIVWVFLWPRNCMHFSAKCLQSTLNLYLIFPVFSFFQTVITRHVAVLSGNLPYPWQTALNSGEKHSRNDFSYDKTFLSVFPSSHAPTCLDTHEHTHSITISSRPQFSSPHSISSSPVGVGEDLLRLLLAKSSLTWQSIFLCCPPAALLILMPWLL